MPRPAPSRETPEGDPLRDASRPGAERLQRVLADLGVASRRACEELIKEGEVEVNDEVVTDLPAWVTPRDRIRVSGRPVARPSAREGRAAAKVEGGRLVYVMLHKPRDTVTTAADPAGRRTVVDLVQHPSGVRLFPIGRLDFDTQGLILLTNDGELANKLTHPRYGVRKTYRALVKGRPTDDALRELERGVYLAERKAGKTVGAERMAPVSMNVISSDRDRSVVEITLAEGRNRQVRRMLAQVGCPVKRLVRVSMGPLSLRGLAVGQWRELTREEVQVLRKAAAGKLRDAEPKRPSRVMSRPGPGRKPMPAPKVDAPKGEGERPKRSAPSSARPDRSKGAKEPKGPTSKRRGQRPR